MKNPFVQMVVMATATAAAFREKFMRENNIKFGAAKSGHPGSKPNRAKMRRKNRALRRAAYVSRRFNVLHG